MQGEVPYTVLNSHLDKVSPCASWVSRDKTGSPWRSGTWVKFSLQGCVGQGVEPVFSFSFGNVFGVWVGKDLSFLIT